MAAFVLFLVLIALADSCDVCKKKRDDDRPSYRPTHWDKDSQSSSKTDVTQNNIHIHQPRDDDCHEKREGHCVGPCNKCCTKPLIRNACSRVKGVNVPLESLTGIYVASYMGFRDLPALDLQTQCPIVVLAAKDRTTCTGSFSYVFRKRDTGEVNSGSVISILYSCGHFTDLAQGPSGILNGVIVKVNPAGLAIMICDNYEGDDAVALTVVLSRSSHVLSADNEELRQCLEEVDNTIPLKKVDRTQDCFRRL